jgi:hypothetical protein
MISDHFAQRLAGRGRFLFGQDAFLFEQAREMMVQADETAPGHAGPPMEQKLVVIQLVPRDVAREEQHQSLN